MEDKYSKYENDPVSFCLSELRLFDMKPEFQEILTALSEPNAQVSVCSHKGFGKTTLSVYAALWSTATSGDNTLSVGFDADDRRPMMAKYLMDLNGMKIVRHPYHLFAPVSAYADYLRVRDLGSEHAPFDIDAWVIEGFNRIICIVDDAENIAESMAEDINLVRTHTRDFRLLLLGTPIADRSNPLCGSGLFYQSQCSTSSWFKRFHYSLGNMEGYSGINDQDRMEAYMCGRFIA